MQSNFKHVWYVAVETVEGGTENSICKVSSRIHNVLCLPRPLQLWDVLLVESLTSEHYLLFTTRARGTSSGSERSQPFSQLNSLGKVCLLYVSSDCVQLKWLLSRCFCLNNLHVGCRWSLPPHKWACGCTSAGEHTSYSPIGSKRSHGNCTQK